MPFTNPFHVDLRSLALARVSLALVILTDLAIRAQDTGAWLSDAGLLPLDFIVPRTEPWRWSLYFLHGSTWWAALLMALQALAALGLLVGYRTRTSALLLLVLLISLHNRNPLLLQGGDNLMLLLVFWSLFLPMGARWSLDAAASRQTPAENRYCSVSSAAVLLQAMAVYFFSAFLKHGAEWVPDGTAIYYALHLDQFATPLGALWRDALWLSQPLTWYVWWLELLGPLLMFSPVANNTCRWAAIIAFVTLEIGFILNLHVGLFPLVSITSMLLFLPAGFWERISSRKRATIYYDAGCDFCEKSCAVLRTMLALPGAQVRTAQSDPEILALRDAHFSWVVEIDGVRHTRSAAMAALLAASPLGWPLAAPARWLRRPGDAIYTWVAHRRLHFGRITALLLPWRQRFALPGLPSLAVAAVFLILLGWWNVVTVTQLSYPGPLAQLKDSLRLDQIWDMFAPMPKQDDGWFVMPGLLEDGRPVDVWQQQVGRPSFAKPPGLPYSQFDNTRWRKTLNRLWLAANTDYRLPFGQWLCRRWDAAGSAPLATFDIYYMEERTPPPGQSEPAARPHRIWRHYCTDSGRTLTPQLDRFSP